MTPELENLLLLEEMLQFQKELEDSEKYLIFAELSREYFERQAIGALNQEEHEDDNRSN